MFTINLSSTYRESSVVESVIYSAFEEIRFLVSPLKSSINVTWQTFPIADILRISRTHGWFTSAVKAPVTVTCKKYIDNKLKEKYFNLCQRFTNYLLRNDQQILKIQILLILTAIKM